MTTFINTSKTEISTKLQNQIGDLASTLRAELMRRGYLPVDWNKFVGVFLLDSNGAEGNYDIIRKNEFRAFIKSLRKVTPHKLPIYESTITKCLEDNPPGVMRVLYVSDESCGAMKLLYNEYAEDPAAGRLRPQDRLQLALEEGRAHMGAASIKLAEDIHAKLKDLPPNEALQAVMDAELATAPELEELRARRAELGQSETELVYDFIARLPQFREGWRSVQDRVKKVVIPPDTSTANNLEVMVMAAAYVFDKVTVGTGLSKEEVSYLIGHFARNDMLVQKLLRRIGESLRGHALSGALQDFSVTWMAQGFPKLEVGQKLAATLAMTEVPDDIEVLAPWKAWSLIVPPGLFGKPSATDGDISRLWCVGTDIKFVVMSSGSFVGQINESKIAALTDGSSKLLWEAMASLVKGACLALANPDDYKRQSVKDRQASHSKKQRDGEPDFSVSRFMLSAPVQIDLRQALIDELEGKKRSAGGGSPTVQFFVRGHWRSQAHGPGRALRKQIRIEGFWKGPEEGRVLLRNYKVKEEEVRMAEDETPDNEGSSDA